MLQIFAKDFFAF